MQSVHKNYPIAMRLSGFGRKMSSGVIPFFSKKGGPEGFALARSFFKKKTKIAASG